MLQQWFSGRLVSHVIVEELVFTALLLFIHVFSIHSCTALLNQLDFGPLQHLDFFLLLQPICWRFAAVCGIIVQLHDPVWAKL